MPGRALFGVLFHCTPHGWRLSVVAAAILVARFNCVLTGDVPAQAPMIMTDVVILAATAFYVRVDLTQT
jgi:hypothetical protein